MKTGTQMSRLTRGLVAIALGAGFATGAMAAATGISITKHNLGTTNTNAANNRVTTGTAEICVFCHTPHAADVTTAGVPLWNKRLATGGTFTVYASSSMNAIGASDGQAGNLSIGSVSLACLSCHDGAQAMDNMLNSPGTGGYSLTGGGASGTNYTWAGTGVDANGFMTNSATTLAMLGKDLSNDHPIGIQYCGGGPRVGATGTACSDADFVTATTGSIGGTDVFWLNSNSAAGRQKDDLPLFNRNFAVNGSLVAGVYPSVECATCHDPHTGTNATFLRISNASSAVCLACHVK